MGTSSGISLPPATPHKGWFGRTWKWLAPSGCLAIIVLIAGFVGGLFALIEGSVALPPQSETDVWLKS
jgi:hypothetical protein